jgi:hypothetical protein
MKTNITRHLIAAAAALVLAGSVAAQEAEKPVAVKVDGLPSQIRTQIQDKARQGPTPLIQYLNRTRMMGYQLRVEDVVQPQDLEAVAKAARDQAKLAEGPDAKK